jgi:sulfate transport system permease protein
VRRTLIGAAVVFLGLFLVLPLAAVFIQALGDGLGPYLNALSQPETLSAIRLTLVSAAIAVPIDLVFGVAAAWLLARFRFPGRSVLLAVIDLPFSISPVVAGLLFVLLFGRQGWLGDWLAARDLHVVFASPGIVLATVFVTLPFIAREALAVLEAQGCSEEEAAMTLGASGWRTFVTVTLPKMKWGLLYGIVLANARAMGEFGAVSVVSGHVRGRTNTIPLHVEILYNEYNFTGAFAVASLLTLLAVVTLAAKKYVEWRSRPQPRLSTSHARTSVESRNVAASLVPKEIEP